MRTVDWIETHQWLMTNCITSSTDKYYSLDSEDDFHSVVKTSVTNNSSFQNYPHPDHHTIQIKRRTSYCRQENHKLLHDGHHPVLLQLTTIKWKKRWPFLVSWTLMLLLDSHLYQFVVGIQLHKPESPLQAKKKCFDDTTLTPTDGQKACWSLLPPSKQKKGTPHLLLVKVICFLVCVVKSVS